VVRSVENHRKMRCRPGIRGSSRVKEYRADVSAESNPDANESQAIRPCQEDPRRRPRVDFRHAEAAALNKPKDWWYREWHAQLGDRTAVQAWFAGDYEAVKVFAAENALLGART
jgi:hypothetical protein